MTEKALKKKLILPVNNVGTGLHPALVMWSQQAWKDIIMELTVSWEEIIVETHEQNQ